MKTVLRKQTISPMAAALWMAVGVPVGIFGQASVLTWHNDNARTGQNLQETALTPANVNASTFGRLFTIAVDGKVDAEPLYVPSVVLANQTTHNALFVVTEHDSVYAFDADTGTSLWQVSLLLTGESPSDNRGCSQVSPEIGITSTPVIDPQMGPHGTMYVVAMSKNGSTYHHRLHALDLTTGAEEFNGPVEVQATYPGHGDGSIGSVLTFDAKQYKERAGLLLWNGMVYTSWASHCDIFPYTAWVIGYNQTNLSRVSVLNLTPNGSDGSVWAAGAGPAADASGNIYLLMANGTFDTTLNMGGFPANGDYGNAFVKILTGGTSVADYFTMSNTVSESNADQDLGSGGAILLPPLIDAQMQSRDLAVGAGKDGNIYVVDRANMGKFNPSSNAIFQELPSAVGSVFSTPAWFNGTLYYGGSGDTLKAFAFTGGTFATSPASHSALSFPYPGTTPSISANGMSNGIVWAVENSGTAVLHAYDTASIGTELYNSNQAANNRDHFGAGNKFIVPMVANGKVYVGTTNGVGTFGLMCGSASIPMPATNATGVPVTPTLSWTAGTGATSYDVALSTSNPPGVIVTGLLAASYTVTSPLAPGTKYYWFVVTHNCAGSTQSPTWSFTTAGGSGNQPPTAVSVTPSSGSGSSRTFGFVFSDPNGFTDLSTTYMLVNSVLDWPGSCYTYYDRGANALWLLNDSASSWMGPVTPGAATSVQNSQCTLNGAGSSPSGSVNNLTVNVALTFKAAFSGAKNVYMNAVDSGSLWSNWQLRGTWTVPSGGNQPPTSVSVTPSSGSGSSQTFGFVFSDPNGFTDLSTTYMLVNSVLDWPGSCYTYYDRGANALWLLNDGASSWMGPVTPGAAMTVQNSQCTLNGAGSSVSSSVNNLTVNEALTFKPAFAGAKNVYLNAVDSGALWSNWQLRGNWTAQ